jgi:hypothetical protein
VTGNQEVIDGSARQDGGKREPSRRLDRKVLKTMDGKIDLPSEQSLLKLLREEPGTLGCRFM